MHKYFKILLKHYEWVYYALLLLNVFKVFPNYFVPLFILYILVFIELVLKKKVNGQLEKKDFQPFYIVLCITIITAIIVGALHYFTPSN